MRPLGIGPPTDAVSMLLSRHERNRPSARGTPVRCTHHPEPISKHVRRGYDQPHLARTGWSYAGDGWSGWDFEHVSGARLEVKQSAALQTWSEPKGIRTRGVFDIAARTGYFDQGGSRWTAQPGRCADIYVFAWHGSQGPDTDHRDPSQWEFYVVPTPLLPAGQKTVVLSRIRRLAATVLIEALASAVAQTVPPIESARTLSPPI